MTKLTKQELIDMVEMGKNDLSEGSTAGKVTLSLNNYLLMKTTLKYSPQDETYDGMHIEIVPDLPDDRVYVTAR